MVYEDCQRHGIFRNHRETDVLRRQSHAQFSLYSSIAQVYQHAKYIKIYIPSTAYTNVKRYSLATYMLRFTHKVQLHSQIFQVHPALYRYIYRYKLRQIFFMHLSPRGNLKPLNIFMVQLKTADGFS